MKQCFRTGVRFSSSPPCKNAIWKIVRYIRLKNPVKSRVLKLFDNELEISKRQGFETGSESNGNCWENKITENRKADKPLRVYQLFCLLVDWNLFQRPILIKLGGLFMCTISIKVPNEILLDLHETQHGFTQYMKQMIAIDLYKNKKISLGYCAELAEMTKEDFINLLSKHEVSIFSFESEEEFKEELENA